MEQLPGSHLLAALHLQMERMKTVVRVSKAASKKPHSRSNTDINYLSVETQNVTLITKDGPAVHRDFCHVLQAVSLSQMQSLRLPGEHKSGVMAYVMQGRLQVRTHSKAAFEHGLDDPTAKSSDSSSGSNPSVTANNSNGGSCAAHEVTSVGSPTSHISSSSSSPSSNPNGSTATHHSNAGNNLTTTNCSKVDGAAAGSLDGSKKQNKAGNTNAPSEADLKALFNSIDKDGSGAIDVEELQYALAVMGIDKSPAEVQELMDSVDKDGSGELEFEEFVLILTTKLGLGGGASESAWDQLPDGTWCLEVQQGGCFGEAALLHGLVQEGVILALEDCSLLILEANSYHPILIHGFDGQLNEKVAILKRCSALASCISHRSDLRGLAYAAASERYGWGGMLYAAGRAAEAIYIIQEGCCRITASQQRIRLEGNNPLSVSSTVGQPSLATAAAEHYPTASGYSCTTGSDLPAAETAPMPVAAGSPAAAAAALLHSPRHGLHSPRSRTVERRMELAVLGPGDIAGEASILGLPSHQSSAVVSSASLLVLTLQKQDLKQLLHPADVQQLTELLQLREDKRQQRLETASATSSAVQLQQQHVKAAAATAACTPELPPAWNSVTEASDSSFGGVLPKSELGWQSECGGVENAGAVCCSNGCSSSRAVASKTQRASEKQQGPIQLPSTAAGVAAAIAAAGGSPRRNLPSRLEQKRVKSVCQLLQSLSVSTQEMEEAQLNAVSCAAAALAAAQAQAAAAAATAAAAGTGDGSLSQRSTSPSGDRGALQPGISSGSSAGVTCGAIMGQQGSLSTSGGCNRLTTHPTDSSNRNGNSYGRGVVGSSSSCPNTARRAGVSDQHVTAADLLLPPGLQCKLEAALEKAGADGMPAAIGAGCCSRSYRNNRTRTRQAASVQSTNPGTVSNDGNISRRSHCGALSVSWSSAHCCNGTCVYCKHFPGNYRGTGCASCPGCVAVGHSSPVPSSRNTGVANISQPSTNCASSSQHQHTHDVQVPHSRKAADETLQLQGQRLSSCNVGHCQHGRGSLRHSYRSSSRCHMVCRSGVSGVAFTNMCGITNCDGSQQHQQHDDDDDNSSHTVDGSGAVTQHQIACRCSVSVTQGGSRDTHGTTHAAASPHYTHTPCIACSPAAVAAAALAGMASSSRSSKSLPAAAHSPTPPRHCLSGASLLQPLDTCIAPDTAIVKTVIQGSAVASSCSSERQSAAAVQDCGSILPHQQICTEATRLLHSSTELQECQKVQFAAQGPAHAPSTNGFFLTDTVPECWSAPACAISEQAAAAFSATLAAAETMRATNSIDLCLSRTSTPRSSRLTRRSRASLEALAMQQAANSTEGTNAAGTAANLAATAIGQSSTAAAPLLSPAGPTCSPRASEQQSIPVLQAPTAACSLTAAMTHNVLAATAAACEVQQRTPRSCRSPRVGTKCIPIQLFSAVDSPVWEAAEAAAACTSWSLGVRVLQSPRADDPNGHASSMQGEGHDTGMISAGRLLRTTAATQKGQQLPALLQQQQQQLSPQQPSELPRHLSAPCIPKLPLHKLGCTAHHTDTCIPVANACLTNTVGAAMQHVNMQLSSTTSSTETSLTDAADNTGCRSVTAAPVVIDSKMMPGVRGSVKARASAQQQALTPKGNSSGTSTPTPRMRQSGSLWQYQQQKQQSNRTPQPCVAPLQQMKLPLDFAIAGTVSMPMAPLPEWRSALTTKWRQGGRFSQQAEPLTESLRVGRSQTSRF